MNRIDKKGKIKNYNFVYVYNEDGPTIGDILKQSYLQYLRSLKR